MKLQKQLNRAGLAVALAVGPSLAWAAEGSAVGDNMIALGLVAALLAFAFMPRGGTKAAPAAEPVPAAVAEAPAAPADEAPAAEGEAVAEEAAPEAPPAEGEAPAAEVASEEAPAESASAAS
jgi:hypothetical protein